MKLNNDARRAKEQFIRKVFDYYNGKINKFNNPAILNIEWNGELNTAGDYKLPNLTLNDNKKGTINKYGMLRLDYLKEHKKALYTTLLMKDELTNHLVSVSKDAENLLNNLMENYKKSDEKLSEKSKKTNQIEWVKLMNNYKNTAEEIILKELIY